MEVTVYSQYLKLVDTKTGMVNWHWSEAELYENWSDIIRSSEFYPGIDDLMAFLLERSSDLELRNPTAFNRYLDHKFVMKWAEESNQLYGVSPAAVDGTEIEDLLDVFESKGAKGHKQYIIKICFIQYKDQKTKELYRERISASTSSRLASLLRNPRAITSSLTNLGEDLLNRLFNLSSTVASTASSAVVDR